MEELLTDDVPKSKIVCRLCLNTVLSECAIAIFENKDSDLDLRELIFKYVQLELSIDDSISSSICQECFDHIEDFHQFYRNVDQKQKSLQQNIFDFLEVKCETDEIDSERKDKIPVQDYLETVQSGELSNEDFASNNGNELDDREEDKLHSNFKTEITDISSDDDTPLNKLYAVSTNKHNAEARGLRLELQNLGSNTKTKKKKPKDGATTPKEPSVYSIVLADCELNCEICNIEIGNFHELKQHFEKKHRHKKVFVMCCGHKYTDRKSIGVHLHRHRDPDKYKCSICGKQFFSIVYLKRHFAARHDESKKKPEPMKCTLCERKFKMYKSFKKHMTYHKNGEIKEKLNGPIECNQCSKSFISEARLKHHQENKHGAILPYQCGACKKSFLTKEEEDIHRSNCRNRELAQKAVKGLVQQGKNSQEAICQICCKIFPTIYRLRNHVASMHENKYKYMCEQCGKKFKLQASFEKHQLIHQGIVEPPVQCETCGKWLKNQDCLRVHRYMHDNSINKCSLCDHVSTTRLALRRHVKTIHRAEHNFHCQYCEKSFKNSTYLEEHMAIHTGAQLYACPHCGKESRSRSNMYAHIKRMHREEWLKKQLARTHDHQVKSQLIKLQ